MLLLMFEDVVAALVKEDRLPVRQHRVDSTAGARMAVREPATAWRGGHVQPALFGLLAGKLALLDQHCDPLPDLQVMPGIPPEASPA